MPSLPRLRAIPTLTSRGQAEIYTFYKISCFTKIHYIYQTTVINQTRRTGNSESTVRTEGLLKHSGYRASGNCRAGQVTQQLKHLPLKHKDQISDFQNPCWPQWNTSNSSWRIETGYPQSKLISKTTISEFLCLSDYEGRATKAFTSNHIHGKHIKMNTKHTNMKWQGAGAGGLER